MGLQKFCLHNCCVFAAPRRGTPRRYVLQRERNATPYRGPRDVTSYTETERPYGVQRDRATPHRPCQVQQRDHAIAISFPSPTFFIPGLKASFSANPSHRSLFLLETRVGPLSLGGQRGKQFLALKVPSVSPIGIKFGPLIVETNLDFFLNFSRLKRSPNAKKIKFSSNFPDKKFLENGPCYLYEIFRICRGSGSPQENLKNWGSDRQFGRGGEANFWIGLRSAPSCGGTVLIRPASFCSHISPMGTAVGGVA